MLKKVFILVFFVVSLYGSKDLFIAGQSSYNYSGNNLSIFVESIRNERNGGKSGTLKLVLWATNYKYRGGRINGFILGESKLGQLKAKTYYANLTRNTQFLPPRYGKYFVTLTLMEYGRNGYVIVDYINYSGRQTMGR